MPATLPAALPGTAFAAGTADAPSAAVAPAAAAAAADVVDTAAPRVPSLDPRHDAPASAAARDTPWPWYRREPWLSVILAAYVPIAVGFATPQEFHALLLGVSGLMVLMSIAMLIRQGPFRPHPRPEATRREATRGAERRAAA